MTEKEFSNNWISRLREKGIRNFPDDFLGDYETEIINLPSVNLLKGEELFGSYEITDSRGNSVYMAENLFRAKYILYSNRKKPHQLKIPLSDEMVSLAVKNYESYLDSILREIGNEYRNYFPKEKNFPLISSEIFSALNLKRF